MTRRDVERWQTRGVIALWVAVPGVLGLMAMGWL